MARRGVARPGSVRLGLAWQGEARFKARHGLARQGKAGQGKEQVPAWRVWAGQGMASRGLSEARSKAGQGAARCGKRMAWFKENKIIRR